MLRTLLARFRAKRVSSPPPETPTYPQKAPVLQTAPVLPKASVEQIWSSWRCEKPAPTSANAAERVNQLKRIGEYETALQVALAEVKLEQKAAASQASTRRSRGITGRRPRSIGSSGDTMKSPP
jgi:hypothetical protein